MGQSAVLESEGIRIKLTNESEGEKIRITNEAEADKTRVLLEAQAEAEALLTVAKAQAESIQLIADAMSRENGLEASRLSVAEQYVKMYGEMGRESNTMIFSDKPADLNSLMAQAASVLESTKQMHTQAPPQAADQRGSSNE